MKKPGAETPASVVIRASHGVRSRSPRCLYGAARRYAVIVLVKMLAQDYKRSNLDIK
jgi:hypothetical protein